MAFSNDEKASMRLMSLLTSTMPDFDSSKLCLHGKQQDCIVMHCFNFFEHQKQSLGRMLLRLNVHGIKRA